MFLSFRVFRSALFGVALALFCAASASANSKPLLWLLEDPESGARVYLFGSLHYGAESFYPLAEPILAAYDQANILAVELDIEELSPQDVRKITKAQGHYSDGQQLSDTLSAEVWIQLAERARSLGLDPAQLSSLKPWLAALQLVNLQVLNSDFDQQLGLDRYFLTQAKLDADKDIHQLETLEQQMTLFSSLTPEEQTSFLAQTLREFDAAPAQLEHLAQAWQSGDEPALAEAILGAFNEQSFSKHLYREVFLLRNVAMAEAAISYLREGEQVFFVVGVGHLVGEQGLVALLERRGYTLERL